jgi:hypothetical protein
MNTVKTFLLLALLAVFLVTAGDALGAARACCWPSGSR